MKRLICIISIISMLTVNTYALDGDVQVSQYDTAINAITALNIIEASNDGKFLPDTQVTRAEFTGYLLKILGVDLFEDVDSLPQIFSDVPSDHAAFAQIYFANKAKMISGYSDGTFQPDEPITYDACIKMIVSALGYDFIANSRGGYPIGYMLIASEKGVTRNVKPANDGIATRGMVAQMLYNALEVDVLQSTVYGSGNKLTSTEGNTLAKVYLNMSIDKGVLNGTPNTRLAGGSPTASGEVEIDGYSYKIGSTNAQEFLGQSVKVYSKIDKTNDEKTILFITREKNTIINLSADSLISYSNYKLKYTENSLTKNEEELSIAGNAVVHYNGAYDSSIKLVNIDELLLIDSSGELKLIDNNNDGLFDVVFIIKYETKIVNNVDVKETSVGLKNGESDITLDVKDSTMHLSILKNGVTTKVGSLKEFDVLSIATSRNSSGEIIKNVIATSKKVSGKITEVIKNDSEVKVVIGEETYAVSPLCVQKDEMAVDSFDTFYLDNYGKIAFAIVLSKRNYGYIIAVATQATLDGNLQARIMDTKGKINIYDAVKKCRVIGYKQTSNTQAEYVDTTSTAEAADFLKYQINTSNSSITDWKQLKIITYELNAKNQITEIKTPKLNLISNSPAYDNDAMGEYELSYDKEIKDATNKVKIGKKRGIFLENLRANNVALLDDTDTLFFDTRATKYEDYKIKRKSDFGDETDSFDAVELYDFNEVHVAKIVVIKGTGASMDIDPESRLFVVDKVNDYLHPNEGAVTKISGFIENRKDEYWMDSSTIGTLGAPKRGDVLQLSADSVSKKIVFYQKVFPLDGINPVIDGKDSSKYKFWAYAKGGEGDIRAIFFGKIAAYRNKNFLLQYGTSSFIPEIQNPYGRPTNVTVIDYRRDINDPLISLGSDADLKKDAIVLMRMNYDYFYDAVIYKMN